MASAEEPGALAAGAHAPFSRDDKGRTSYYGEPTNSPKRSWHD